VFVSPPPRRVAPSKENNAAPHSCEHGSRGIISLACPSDKVGGEKVLHTTLETTHSQKDLLKRGRGRRHDDPFKRLSKTAFDAQNKRFPQTKSLLQREKVPRNEADEVSRGK